MWQRNERTNARENNENIVRDKNEVKLLFLDFLLFVNTTKLWFFGVHHSWEIKPII